MQKLLAVFAVAFLAACAPQSYQDLHRPYGAGGNGPFGYAEQRLDDRHYLVSYIAPPETGFTFTGQAGAQAADYEVSRAYEFALARAAEIALANGFPAFRVEDRRNDAMSQNYEAWKGPFFRPQRNYAMDDAYLNARVVLTVALLPTLESGAYDASSTLAAIRSRYTAPPPA